MKQYYYKDGQTQLGPFSLKEIKAKNLSPETPVWYHPLTKWTTAGEVKELQKAPEKASDKIYYYREAGTQFGPFALAELKGKNITAATQVWYHPLPQWTTAGEVEELKQLMGQTVTMTETKTEVKAEVKPAPAKSSEKKYYYRAGTTQYGPLALEELKGKGISVSTQVWYHPLPQWTTAGEVAELKGIIEQSPVKAEVKEMVKEEVKPVAKSIQQPATNGTGKKYYYRQGTTQFGPLALEDMKGRGITASTQIWYHPLPQWTTAGQVDELKGILAQPVLKTGAIEEVKPAAQTVAQPVTTATVTVTEVKEEVKTVTQPAQVVSAASVTVVEEKKTETLASVVAAAARKYYYHDGVKQNGPFTFDELKGRNVKPEMLVWYDPMPEWLPASQIEELKSIIVAAPPPVKITPAPVVEVKEPVKAGTPVTASAPITVAATAANPARSPRTNTAWVSWLFSLLVLGGVGYLVYTDMIKDNSKISGLKSTNLSSDNNGNNSGDGVVQDDPGKVTPDEKGVNNNSGDGGNGNTTASTNNSTNKSSAKTSGTTKPATTKTSTATTKTSNTNATGNDTKPATSTSDKNAIYRNQWPNFISFGKLDYKSGALSGIKAFDVPVINRTGFTLDKVTVRLDYIKKGGGVYKTETLTVSNVPPNSTASAKAPASSRGTSVNAYITGISSRKLNFCYPLNNGNPADPYYCK